MRTDFELAEILWDAAEFCLEDEDRQALSFALHVDDPFLAIFGVIRAVVREDHPLPHNIFCLFKRWLVVQPPLSETDPLMSMRLELHVIASAVRSTPQLAYPVGGYGEATLCFFVFDDAGVTEAGHDEQAAALLSWLRGHRPSPVLRFDMHRCGFGYLLDGVRRLDT
jgi:hypothetical protein